MLVVVTTCDRYKSLCDISSRIYTDHDLSTESHWAAQRKSPTLSLYSLIACKQVSFGLHCSRQLLYSIWPEKLSFDSDSDFVVRHRHFWCEKEYMGHILPNSREFKNIVIQHANIFILIQRWVFPCPHVGQMFASHSIWGSETCHFKGLFSEHNPGPKNSTMALLYNSYTAYKVPSLILCWLVILLWVYLVCTDFLSFSLDSHTYMCQATSAKWDLWPSWCE